MKLAKSLFVSLLVFSATIASAQPGWNWGDQIDVAKEKNALYTDFVKAGQYKKAIAPHSWLLENTPDLNVSIYINGATIYEGLVETEKDPGKSEEYKEKALEMYKLRMKYFNDSANVMNRMIFPAYKFYKKDKSKYKEVIGYFEKALELNGPDIYGSNLVAYMDLIRRYKLTGGEISDVEIIDIYTGISDVFDAQIERGQKADRVEKYSDTVDKILTSTVDLNCDFVEDKLGPKLEETGDIKMAKKIFQLMLTGKCTDRPLAYEAAKIVHAEEPSFGIAKFLGVRAAQNNKADEAEQYYKEAIDLTDENTKKAEIYMNLARLEFSRGRKVSARANARRALSFDPTMSEAYSLIGDMYFGSQECQEKESKVKDFAIYIAAYKMYERAGDREGMNRAKQYFPTINDIFSENYEEGQTIQVGCWINESVVLQRRPEE